MAQRLRLGVNIDIRQIGANPEDHCKTPRQGRRGTTTDRLSMAQAKQAAARDRTAKIWCTKPSGSDGGLNSL